MVKRAESGSQPDIRKEEVQVLPPYPLLQTKMKPVGKRVGPNIYFHISALEQNLEYFSGFKKFFLKNFYSFPELSKFSVIKFNTKENKITFTLCPFFFENLNPVSYGYRKYEWNENLEITSDKSAYYKVNRVYHEAGKFVPANKYRSFVQKSKDWNAEWKSAAREQNLSFRNIGYEDSWKRFLVKLGLAQK